MQYLLERLAQPHGATRGPLARADLRAAVRAQIQRVVASHFEPGRPGLDLMGMNLPHLADAGYACRRDIEHHAARIRELVLAHEPRLAGVSVTLEPTGRPLVPHEVVVSGLLSGSEDCDTFRFDLPRRG